MRPCSLIPFLAFISFLSTVHSSSDGRRSRRVLHEPLFPIQWTPPPPPPDFPDPPPPPTGPFFPDSPPTGLTPTAANVSVPSPPSNPSSTATKNIAIGVVVALAALAILFFSAFLLYRRRIGRPRDSAKLITGEDGSARRFRNPGRPAASASEFLYLGTMEPASRRVSGELNGSPYRKLSSERVVEVHYPSPELQPLPPLGGPPPPPPRRGVVPPPVGSSDDETFYTPHRSVASMTSESPSSPVSRRSLPSVGSGGKEVLVLTVDSAPPRSRRTSPRRQLSNGSASEVKQMIPPVTRQPPQPPPPPPPPPRTPPPPPPLPPPKAEKITATRPPQPPRPPPHPAGRNKPSSQAPAAPEPAELFQRRRLLKPLPPEGPRINLPASVSKFSNGDGCSSSKPVDRTGDNMEGEAKPRLKPLHWDRVRASSDRPMVWDQLKSSSFQ